MIVSRTVVLDGTAKQIGLADGKLSTFKEIKLANDSPYQLRITIGIDEHLLDARQVDKYPLYGQESFGLQYQQLVGGLPLPTFAPSGTLLVSTADNDSQIPGVYPAPLARDALPIGAYSGTLLANALSTLLPVAGASSFLLRIANPSGSAAQVFGTIDGINSQAIDCYKIWPGPATRQPLGNLSASGLYLVPCAGFQDLLISAGPGGTVDYTATAITGSDLLVLLGQQPMASSYPVAIASDQAAIPVSGLSYATADTQSATGFKTGPAAGDVVVTLTPGAGVWRLLLWFGYASATADGVNFELRKNAGVIRRLVGGASGATAGFDRTGPVEIPRLTLAGGDTVSVNATGIGGGGTIYVASIDAQKLTN